MPCLNDFQEQKHAKKYKCNCTCPSYRACRDGWKEFGETLGFVQGLDEAFSGTEGSKDSEPDEQTYRRIRNNTI